MVIGEALWAVIEEMGGSLLEKAAILGPHQLRRKRCRGLSEFLLRLRSNSPRAVYLKHFIGFI